MSLPLEGEILGNQNAERIALNPQIVRGGKKTGGREEGREYRRGCIVVGLDVRGSRWSKQERGEALIAPRKLAFPAGHPSDQASSPFFTPSAPPRRPPPVFARGYRYLHPVSFVPLIHTPLAHQHSPGLTHSAPVCFRSNREQPRLLRQDPWNSVGDGTARVLSFTRCFECNLTCTQKEKLPWPPSKEGGRRTGARRFA